MELDRAQGTQVVRMPQLFSLAEIDSIHAAAEKVRDACGKSAVEWRGEKTLVWDVLYMHSDGWFPKLLPELHAKLLRTMRAVDREHWQMAGEQDTVNVRCAEYHCMLKGGSLRDPGHFDKGSLVTLDVMLAR
jgi:hypothetical protein